MKFPPIGLVEVLFPTRCPACRSLVDEPEEEIFCRVCAGCVSYITSPLCPRCGVPFASPLGEDHLCGSCLENPPDFHAARALGRFEGPLREAVHRFKYGGDTAAGKALGVLMADYTYPGFCVSNYDLVVPVPLHIRRLRQRGFNQALVLARAVARRYHLPLDFTVLRRHIDTPPQVALDRKERARNVRGAFAVENPLRIRGRRVLIIDDVYTTGSTLSECAGLLMACGVEEAAVLTAARVV